MNICVDLYHTCPECGHSDSDMVEVMIDQLDTPIEYDQTCYRCKYNFVTVFIPEITCRIDYTRAR